MTWNVCREKTLYTQGENGNKTLLGMQVLRRGKASSACFPQQRWAPLSFWWTPQWRDFLDALLGPRSNRTEAKRAVQPLEKKLAQDESCPARRGRRCCHRGGVSAASLGCAGAHAAKTRAFSLRLSQPSALLADGVLRACPALHKGESSGLAENWKGEFELVAFPGLVWEDLRAHPSCRSPLWWWAPADYQWAAPRKDFGISSVLSRPSRGHWSKPFTAHSAERKRTSSSCDCVKLQR